MIETMVSVLILGLVVTASLKLVALSQRGLWEARAREEILREASILQIKTAQNPLDIFGTLGDVDWKVTEESSPLWKDGGIDIASLGFSNEANAELESFKARAKKWREITVTKNGKTIKLFLPPKSELVSSGDRM